MYLLQIYLPFWTCHSFNFDCIHFLAKYFLTPNPAEILINNFLWYRWSCGWMCSSFWAGATWRIVCSPPASASVQLSNAMWTICTSYAILGVSCADWSIICRRHTASLNNSKPRGWPVIFDLAATSTSTCLQKRWHFQCYILSHSS